MSKRRFTEAEKQGLLQEVEHLQKCDMPLEKALKMVGITDATYFRWRQKYGWLPVEEAQRLRELEEENAHLRQLISIWSGVEIRGGAIRKSNPATLAASQSSGK